MEKGRDLFNGRLASELELLLLSKHFKDISFINEFKFILERYRIIGQKFTLTEQEDHSGTGMEMQWLTPDEQIEEAFKFYPGIIVIKHDYLPIGMCLSGSGDPYFLKVDKNTWKIYRVLHDVALENVYEEDMVEYVISFDDLIKSL